MSLLTSLESYWKFDESSGTALDSHGSNHLLLGGSASSVAGKINTSRYLDNFTVAVNYFDIADNASISTGDIDFTFAGWFFIQSGAAVCLLSKWNANPTLSEFVLYRTGGYFDWYVADAAGSGSTQHVQATNYGTPPSGQFIFIVVWHDSVNNQIGIQINNGTRQTASWSSGVLNSANPFRVGRDQASNYWDGRIDELGFWKGRVLTSGDVTELWNSGNGKPYSDFGVGAAVKSIWPYYMQSACPTAGGLSV